MKKIRQARDPYKILGVERDATADDIKAAYRNAAKTAHPDKGGSVEAMADVNWAYDILRDAVKRAHYDTHGIASDEVRLNELHQGLIQLFMSIVRSVLMRKDTPDILAMMRKELRTRTNTAQEEIANNQRLIAELKKLRPRIKRKKKAEQVNIFTYTLDQSIDAAEASIKTQEAEILKIDEMSGYLDEYGFEMPKSTADDEDARLLAALYAPLPKSPLSGQQGGGGYGQGYGRSGGRSW